MKKLLLIPGIIGLLLVPAITSGEFDLPGLNHQVQVQQSQLDNHEARITNLEKDTSALQVNTNTAPAPDPTPVPQTNHDAVTPDPTAQPDPQPAPKEDKPVEYPYGLSN